MAVSVMVSCDVSQSCPLPADLHTVTFTAGLATAGTMMGDVTFSLFSYEFLLLCIL